MYCPKCGSSNPDGVHFCRQCAEDLQAVGQLMKGHASVALVTKIDAVLERKNEVFRRDAILSAIMGVAFLVPAILDPFGPSTFYGLNLTFLFLGIFGISYSGWQLLLYRRSLEPRLALSDASAQHLASPEDGLDWIFCPKCGHRNPNAAQHCSSCGFSLDFDAGPRGLEKYLPDSLVHRLDERVRQNEQAPFKPRYKSGSTLLLVAIIYLLNVAIQGWKGDWGILMVYLSSGLALVISGAWNLIGYRRNEKYQFGSIDESLSIPGDAPESVSEDTTELLELPSAEIEEACVPTTRKLTKIER